MMLIQAPPAARLYIFAADRDQGALVIHSIQEIVAQTPGLAPMLHVRNFHVVVEGTGTTLEVMAADAPSAWGLRPYFAAVDELAQWRETRESLVLYEAIRTPVSKRLGRMVVCTTPGDPAHFARDIRDHADEDPLWHLLEVPGPLPWADPERLAEQERSLAPSRYARLHLGQWAEPENRLAALADLQACVRPEATLNVERELAYVIGVDVGLKHDRTAAAVCHAEERVDRHELTEKVVVVDQLKTWQGTSAQPVDLSAVEDWLAETAVEYNGALILLDPWQTAQMQQRLKQRGHRVEEVTPNQTTNGQLAATLHNLIRQQRLQLPDDDLLLHELARVELRETAPGLLRLEHRQGDHDDQAFAVGTAAVRLLARSVDGPRIRVLVAPPPPPRLGLRW